MRSAGRIGVRAGYPGVPSPEGGDRLKPPPPIGYRKHEACRLLAAWATQAAIHLPALSLVQRAWRPCAHLPSFATWHMVRRR